MRYLRPKLWVLMILIAAVGALIDHLRPLRSADAIRAALPAVEEEYPGLIFDPGEARATWFEPRRGGGGGLWIVEFEGPDWYVGIDVTPAGRAGRPRRLSKSD